MEPDSTRAEDPWTKAGEPPRLGDLEIHVFSERLDVSPERLRRCLSLLAPDERAREAAFHFERDRARFAAARGFLRELLGAYLGEDPARLGFRYGPQRKPELDRPGALHFNVAHSEDTLFVALTSLGPLGVDVEHVRRDFPCLQVARTFFTAKETAWIAGDSDSGSGSEDTVADRFFVLWTRKESYLKAVGGGLSIPLDSIDVTSPPEGWSIIDLPAGAGCAAALARRSGTLATSGARILLFRWMKSR